MTIDQLKPNKVLSGPIFPEPVQVIITLPMGDAVKLVGKGVNTSRVKVEHYRLNQASPRTPELREDAPPYG